MSSIFKFALCVLVFSAVIFYGALSSFAASSDNSSELIVFAAASMTETLNQIKTLYEAKHPGVSIIYNFDSSGTLKTQIQEGAPCDIFISAAPRQMNQLEELGLIIPETRINLLENKVALAVPEGNPKDIKSYDDLSERLKAGNILLAMGNSDVPVGQYTQKIFAFYGLDEAGLAKSGVLTYGSNVKEVTTQVAEAAVDCGIIYATDAFSAKLQVIDTATKEMCGQVIYPASILKDSKDEMRARSFLNYLTGSEADEVFKSVGFSPMHN